MSRSENQYQAQRWLMTAKEDLQAAEVLFRAEMYAHACFQAHQEVAGRALNLAVGPSKCLPPVLCGSPQTISPRERGKDVHMAWTRQILGVMGVIMAQLVFGGISLSLGLMVGVLLLGVAIIVLAALAACGLCFILERLHFLDPGWTDERLRRLKSWAKGSPQMISVWKDGIKKEIRDYLEDTPDSEEQRLSNRIKKLQVLVIMQAVVIAILLVMQTTHLSVRAAIVVVMAFGAVIAVGMIYFMNLVPESADNPGTMASSHDTATAKPEQPGPSDAVI